MEPKERKKIEKERLRKGERKKFAMKMKKKEKRERVMEILFFGVLERGTKKKSFFHLVSLFFLLFAFGLFLELSFDPMIKF